MIASAPHMPINEGKVFAWDEGEVPGEAENCRCSAEPFPEYTSANNLQRKYYNCTKC